MARPSSFSLPVGALVGMSLTTWLRNLAPFTLLSALVLSPWIAFRIFVQPTVEPLEPSLLPLLSVLLESLLTYVLTGALTYGVVMQLRDQHAGMSKAIAMGMQTFGGVLGTGILCGLRIFLFSLLLLVPGIIQAVRLYVALPVAVMERKSGSAAIRRSEELTSGSGWPIFGSWMLVYLINMGLFMLAGFLIATSEMFSPASIMWFEIFIALFVNSFTATLMAVCYFMLRQGKENVDAKMIAAVFD